MTVYFLLATTLATALLAVKCDDLLQVLSEPAAINSEQLRLRFSLKDREYTMSLMRDESIVDANFLFINRQQQQSNIVQVGRRHDNFCHYSGQVHVTHTPMIGQTSVDVCGGLSGIIKFGDHIVLIETVKLDYETSVNISDRSSQPPVIEVHAIKRLLYYNNTDKMFRPDSNRTSSNVHDRRTRRSVEQLRPLTVELGVFVDQLLQRQMSALYGEHMNEEIQRFVITMVVAIEMMFDDASIGRRVRFSLKRLELVDSDAASHFSAESGINRLLSSFCRWQRRLNPPSDRHPLHWDHAVLLTGVDLFSGDGTHARNTHVVGYAPVGGMCAPLSSCTVNEGRSFESVYIVAHEIGHSLGMQHDGDNNQCNRHNYIMSATLAVGRSSWSECSRRYLDHFTSSDQARCLFDGEEDTQRRNTLPGERVGADEQCRLQFGVNSRRHKQQSAADICVNLHCSHGHHRCTSHPALEGTSCGPSSWCRRRHCVSRDYRLDAHSAQIDGRWSEWGAFSPCASSCLHDSDLSLTHGSSGLQVRYRRCDNPYPSAGGRGCDGSSVNYRTCNAGERCRRTNSRTVAEYAERICSKAAQQDAHLVGLGAQRTMTGREDSCRVWCLHRDGSLQKHVQSFPNGVRCRSSEWAVENITSLCVDGKCEIFGCKSKSPFLLNKLECIGKS